ncbi:uncharacterized protein [Euwallacea similis]|uniref:uncharacterized protein n=1 Tax=Euwallacea similis TaxID=1736056 RepID=UPI00344DE7D3
MEWSNETVLDFLDYYEKEPVIWNARHSQHNNRNVVFDAWKRIERNMGGNYTVTDLKRKKDSLMASFRTRLKKVRLTIQNEAGADELYVKPSWFAYEKMARFLLDKDEPKDIINSEEIDIDTTQGELWEEQFNENHETREGHDCETKVFTGRCGIDFGTSGSIAGPGSSNQKPSNFPLAKAKRKSDLSELPHKIEEAYSVLPGPPPKNVKQRDVCDIYGELVTEKLKELDERTRDIAMNRMDNILFELKMKQNIE